MDPTVGPRPYALAVQNVGIVRLWISEEGVYREDTDTFEPCWVEDDDSVIAAAHELLA